MNEEMITMWCPIHGQFETGPKALVDGFFIDIENWMQGKSVGAFNY